MADGTSIEWARHPVTGKGASWNPVLARRRDNGKVGYHCEHVSPGCENCYAETFNQRGLPARGTKLEFKPGHRDKVEIFLDPKQLMLPFKWRDPRGVFVCSMSDLFGEFVPDAMIDQMFAIMALAPRHVFMVLTKRAKRMRRYLNDPSAPRRIYELACDLALDHGLKVLLIAPGVDEAKAPPGERVYLGQWPLKNVWLGTSAEDQRRFDERWPQLRATPAARRFLSLEPLLGRVDMCEQLGMWWNQTKDEWIHAPGIIRPDWVIAGFESGSSARAVDAPDIARSLRDQCATAGVRFLFKQWGAYAFAPDGYHKGAAIGWATSRRFSLSRRTEAWGGGGGLPSNFEELPSGRFAFNVGKKDAGRELDGRVHDEMPELVP